MCTLLGQFSLDCGAAPTFIDVLPAGGVAMVIVFLVRP